MPLVPIGVHQHHRDTVVLLHFLQVDEDFFHLLDVQLLDHDEAISIESFHHCQALVLDVKVLERPDPLLDLNDVFVQLIGFLNKLNMGMLTLISKSNILGLC